MDYESFIQGLRVGLTLGRPDVQIAETPEDEEEEEQNA
jgi:hypothetical protein